MIVGRLHRPSTHRQPEGIEAQTPPNGSSEERTCETTISRRSSIRKHPVRHGRWGHQETIREPRFGYCKPRKTRGVATVLGWFLRATRLGTGDGCRAAAVDSEGRRPRPRQWGYQKMQLEPENGENRILLSGARAQSVGTYLPGTFRIWRNQQRWRAIDADRA
jgi:hypothetical protein